MESKQVASASLDSPSSGNPVAKISNFDDVSELDKSNDDVVAKVNGENLVKSGGGGGGSDDEEGVYLSGGEEFETPVAAEEGSEGGVEPFEDTVEVAEEGDGDEKGVAKVFDEKPEGIEVAKSAGKSGEGGAGEVFDEKTERDEVVKSEGNGGKEGNLEGAGEVFDEKHERSEAVEAVEDSKESEEDKVVEGEGGVKESLGSGETGEKEGLDGGDTAEVPRSVVSAEVKASDVGEALFDEKAERDEVVEGKEGGKVVESKDVAEGLSLVNEEIESKVGDSFEPLDGQGSLEALEVVASVEGKEDVPKEDEAKFAGANVVNLMKEQDFEAGKGGIEENGIGEKHGSIADGQSGETVETAEREVVDADGVKVGPERNSVTDAAMVEKEKEDGDAEGSGTVDKRSGSVEADQIREEVSDKEVVAGTDGEVETHNLEPVELIAADSVEPVELEAVTTDTVTGQMQNEGLSNEKSETVNLNDNERNSEAVLGEGADDKAKENGQVAEVARDVVPNVDGTENGTVSVGAVDDVSKIGSSDGVVMGGSSVVEANDEVNKDGEMEGPVTDVETDGMVFGSSEAAKLFIEELERASRGGSQSGGESSQDHSLNVDGQIVTDSDEEEEGEGKEIFDSAALTALLKAATGGGVEGGNITITSQDGSRLFSVERPAGLGPSLQSLRPASRPARSNIFSSSSLMRGEESENNLSEEDRKKLEKLQSIRVKFLRIVQRLGLSPDDSVVAQVLYRLALVAGRQTGQFLGLDAAKEKALELEARGEEDLDFSVNILVVGKSGVGKSATINSIFGEDKVSIDAFQPSTAAVKEISGMVDGVRLRVLDTPGLKSSVMDQGFNRNVLASAKKITKKNPPDIVLYVDRLDAQTRDLNDLPLLRTITSSLGASIWRSAIVTLTHAASAPPEGPSGSPLSYEVFVTQRSHVVQQSIGQAVGDLRMMSPSLMNPVSLVENHPLCRKNREGHKVLPNGQSWRPQLLLLCYSMKILAEANSITKPQDPFDHRKLFGFRVRSPPLPYMLSSMLQSRAHPKLSSEQGGDNGDSDIDLADLSDSDQEEDGDEYDQLPPFKPLKKSQLAKLSKEQRNAYYEEYDYRVKLLQKKQWKEELKRMREMKKNGKDAVSDIGYPEEETDSGAPAPVAVPLPDMALPPSFDGDNPAYRYRFLEPSSQFLARPVLDSHGWDHDCGYDGVNIEQSLAIASRFPAVISVQTTKDKKDFTINLDSSVSVKHGENGSTMAGFDVQPIGKQLAYIVRGETKFKNLKRNKTAAGVSVTFLGENVVTGLKVEDQISFGKQYSLVGSAGTVRYQNDSAYGANIEVQRREIDYPIGQVQSTFGLSIIKWRGDLALGFNSLAQFSVGRGSKVAVRAGINNKMSGQITIRTSSSEYLSIALAGVVPTVLAIYRKLRPESGEKYVIY